MGLAEFSVRKKNSEVGDFYGREDEPVFAVAKDYVREELQRSAGKALLISEDACSFFSEAACSPRTISVVFDGDCLPLFSMPDGVSRVMAAGGSELLRAARYFAEVRGISCTLFPVDAKLDGVYEKHAEVQLGGTPLTVPLGEAKVVLDEEILTHSLFSAYIRILLARLAQIEVQALSAFRGEKKEENPIKIPEELSFREIVSANVRERMRESYSTYIGEGVILSELLKESAEPFPEWRAFCQLSALYAAFFEKGKPRRYFTPNYSERAARAGTKYPISSVPSAEEYALRALTLERIRAPFTKAVFALRNERALYENASKLCGEPLPHDAGNLTPLSILPEHVPHGLSALIRDFGLMEGL